MDERDKLLEMHPELAERLARADRIIDRFEELVIANKAQLDDHEREIDGLREWKHDFINEHFSSLQLKSMEMENKMKAMAGNGQPGLVDKIDDRVRQIEKWMWAWTGAIAILGPVAGYLIAKVLK